MNNPPNIALFIAATALISIVITSGCASTPQAQLADIPQTDSSKAKGSIYIGPFFDKRQYDKNFSTEHLGTVRGGFGNVLMRVIDWRGADEFMREHTINAARHSSFVADSTPDSIAVKEDGDLELTSSEAMQDIRPILSGTINKLAVESGGSRFAETDIDVSLIDPVSEKPVWTHKMLLKDTSGIGSGIAEDTTLLKSWLAKVIQDQVLEYFSTLEFQEGVKLISDSIEHNQEKFTTIKMKDTPIREKMESTLPDGDFFYYSDSEYVTVKPITTTTEVSHRRLWVPFAGLPGERFFFIQGEHASLNIAERKPAFFTRRKPSRVKLVQLGYRKSVDKRFVVYVSYKSDREKPFISEEVERGIYKLVPKNELKAGEYAFLVGDKEMIAFDFSIR